VTTWWVFVGLLILNLISGLAEFELGFNLRSLDSRERIDCSFMRGEEESSSPRPLYSFHRNLQSSQFWANKYFNWRHSFPFQSVACVEEGWLGGLAECEDRRSHLIPSNQTSRSPLDPHLSLSHFSYFHLSFSLLGSWVHDVPVRDCGGCGKGGSHFPVYESFVRRVGVREEAYLSEPIVQGKPSTEFQDRKRRYVDHKNSIDST